MAGMRERILETALERFESQGYAATSLRDIAQDLSTTKAAIYYHFQTKQHIVQALVDPVSEQLAKVTDDIAADHDGDLRSQLRQYVQAYIENLRVLTWLTNDMTVEIDRSGHEKLRRQLRDRLVAPTAAHEDLFRANCAVLLLHYPVWSRWSESDLDLLLDIAVGIAEGPGGEMSTGPGLTR